MYKRLLPVYAIYGWVIDLTRRREDAFRDIMEFFIAELAPDIEPRQLSESSDRREPGDDQ